MKKFLALLAVGCGVLVVLGVVVFLSVMGLRNNLVRQEENVSTQWAQVEVQYQRRFDLIPNLVSSVRGILEQEQEVFGDIADARTRYSGAPSGSQERVEAANELESALGRLLVIMENYPELRSNETVQALMVELEGTENRISTERRRYNDVVNEFNQTIRVFPNSLVNDLFLHFDAKERFEAVEGADVAPEVDLDVSE
ncbi:MAG: LemA family protein [Candidatus Dojkabacteria bacterium]|nr:LemA family protein [Candidatus Dojkabacteria bacterium]